MFRKMYAKRTLFVLLALLAVGLTWGSKAVQALSPDPATLLYVKSMGVSFYDVGGPKRQPFAVVDIVDGNGVPVNGALVVGDWSGCFKEVNDSALTQTYFYTQPDGTVVQVDGRAVIASQKTFSCWGAKQTCYFTFTITGVSKAGMTYVPVNGYGTSWSRTPCS